jgi:hypothetical protein
MRQTSSHRLATSLPLAAGGKAERVYGNIARISQGGRRVRLADEQTLLTGVLDDYTAVTVFAQPNPYFFSTDT